MKTEEKLDFWEFSEEQKISMWQEIKEKKGISPKAAEKDWWVCHVIKSIFELRCAPYLTFKGGTSLSKAWGVTRRFSEDVDISFDKSFFGLDGDTRSQRDRIRKLSRKYIHNELWDELSANLWVWGARECEVTYKPRKDSDADPTVLLIPYRSLLPEDPYIKSVVKVEFSCRSPREPREPRNIVPFVSEFSPVVSYPETNIPTVVPTRTFLEKVFLLHEEFQKDYPRHRRMSRHLYDIHRLAEAGYAQKAMQDEELYASLVRHRSIFNAVRGIDYSRHTPQQLSFLPKEDLLPLWEEDYKLMQEQFIYGESLPFSELIRELTALQEELRAAPFTL